MKIQAFLFIAALLLFTSFIQDTEGVIGLMPPGRRELNRKVCIPGYKIEGNFADYTQIHSDMKSGGLYKDDSVCNIYRFKQTFKGFIDTTIFPGAGNFFSRWT